VTRYSDAMPVGLARRRSPDRTQAMKPFFRRLSNARAATDFGTLSILAVMAHEQTRGSLVPTRCASARSSISRTRSIGCSAR
jgi:hypothetical protein